MLRYSIVWLKKTRAGEEKLLEGYCDELPVVGKSFVAFWTEAGVFGKERSVFSSIVTNSEVTRIHRNSREEIVVDEISFKTQYRSYRLEIIKDRCGVDI
jgi:hypothetical protein